MSFKRVTSSDGTPIAFGTLGLGPPVILVGGAFCDRNARTSGSPLAALLANRFGVHFYDRRGRGDSGDTRPYAVEREREDLSALIAETGGPVSIFGHSSGALLALDTATRERPGKVAKLALYEPPLVLDPKRARSLEGLAKELDALVAANRRGDAAGMFMTRAMQMPPQLVAEMRQSPDWASRERLAHTLANDLLVTARSPDLLAEAASLRAPTLVMDGGSSPPWMRDANQALASAIPGALHRTLEGQAHDVDLAVLARALDEFFGD